jgi:hypothetical protein
MIVSCIFVCDLKYIIPAEYTIPQHATSLCYSNDEWEQNVQENIKERKEQGDWRNCIITL